MALPRYQIKSAYFNPDGSNKQLFFSKIGNTPTINIQEQNRLMNPDIPNIEKDFTPSYNPQEAVKLQQQRIAQQQELERQQALKDQQYWLRTANQAGVGRTFNNLDEVKAFQQEIGLTGNQVDGKIGTTTLGQYSKWLAKQQPIAESQNVSQLPEQIFTHGEQYNPNNTSGPDYGKYLTKDTYYNLREAWRDYLRNSPNHQVDLSELKNWLDYNYSPKTVTGMSGQEQRVRGWTRKQERGGIMEYFNNNKQINKFASGGKNSAKNVLTTVIQGLLGNNREEMLQRLQQIKTQPGGEQQYNSIKEAVREMAKTNKSAAQAIQIWEQYENQAQMAEKGAKLEFVKQLKGICPEGTEKIYLKNGGCMCKKAKMEKGDKMENKKEFFDAKKEKCGGKMKKHQDGGVVVKEAYGPAQTKYKNNRGQIFYSDEGDYYSGKDTTRNGITLITGQNDLNNPTQIDSTFIDTLRNLMISKSIMNGKTKYQGNKLDTGEYIKVGEPEWQGIQKVFIK